jgi:hypothetical protein
LIDGNLKVKVLKLMNSILIPCLLGMPVYSQANNNALDIPVIAPLGKHVQTNTPNLSDFYQECIDGSNSEQTTLSKAIWSSCNGFVLAATQAATNNGKGTCPPVTLRDVLSRLDANATEYTNKHSEPFYDKNGKQSGITLHKDFIDPWKEPALPSVITALQNLGCKP